MIEAPTTARTRAALERAHVERGRAVRNAFRWLTGRKPAEARRAQEKGA